MRYWFIFVLFLGLPIVSLAQEKEIGLDEYYKPFRDALSKARTLSRRNTQRIKSNWEGKSKAEEWTYEYQVPDRIRFIHLETTGGKTKRTEQINIGETKYCKKDDGEWIISESYCIGGSGSGGPSNIIKEVYRRVRTSLQGKQAVLYHEYTTYKNIYSKTADSDGPSFWETKYWIDDDGLLLRYESRRGLVASPTASYEMVETYDYDSKITIEIPMK